MTQTQAPTLPTPEQAFKMYQDNVEGGGSEGAIPIMTICTNGELQLIAMAMDVPPRFFMKEMLASLIGDGPRPDWICFSAESWTQTSADRERTGMINMQAARKAGDATVGECVLIIGVSTTQEWSYTREFVRSDGHVVWGKEKTDSGHRQAGGPLVDALREAVHGTDRNERSSR